MNFAEIKVVFSAEAVVEGLYSWTRMTHQEHPTHQVHFWLQHWPEHWLLWQHTEKMGEAEVNENN